MSAPEIKQDVAQLVNQVKSNHLKKFRPARGADSKELYQKRLTAFVEELIQELK